jgi:hypothetical protein
MSLRLSCRYLNPFHSHSSDLLFRLSFDPSLRSMYKFLDLTIVKPWKEVLRMEGVTVIEASVSVYCFVPSSLLWPVATSRICMSPKKVIWFCQYQQLCQKNSKTIEKLISSRDLRMCLSYDISFCSRSVDTVT